MVFIAVNIIDVILVDKDYIIIENDTIIIIYVISILSLIQIV